jgi:hypothetical protein
MTAALCALTNVCTGAATPPNGGSIFGSAYAYSVLYQVTAELHGYTVPPNDGAFPVTQIFKGTVAPTSEIDNGFKVTEKDAVPYVISVPFIDQLFQGSTPLTAPFSVYYLLKETYLLNNFVSRQDPGLADRFTITRKVRPLTAGGAVQAVSSVLV